jgi:hypothetical protein
MKKYFVLSFALLFSFCLTAFSQTNLSLSQETQTGGQKMAFKTNRELKENTADVFDIQSIGGTTFTTSNVADGTTASFTHNTLVNVTLVPAVKPEKNKIQLVFYSSSVNIYQAAMNMDGTINVFYPISLYDAIREKLDQALAAKKKVQVKVVQQTSGYREGSLIF